MPKLRTVPRHRDPRQDRPIEVVRVRMVNDTKWGEQETFVSLPRIKWLERADG